MKIRFIIKESKLNNFIKKVGPIPLFVHFSDSPEWGSITKTWTGYKWNNPAGIYTYMFKPNDLKHMDTSFLYGSDREYIHLFTVNPNHKGQILSIGTPKNRLFNFPQYTEKDLELDIKKILSKVGQERSRIDQAKIDSKQQTPIGHLWNITRVITKDAKEWTSLLRWLGYDGFVDHGTGLIHENEPSQCLFLGGHILNHLDSFKNPNSNKPKVKPKVKQKVKQKVNFLKNGGKVELVDGSKCWYNKNGQLHRENGPAVEWANGGKFWWLNGQRHREDGPAIEYANGGKEWWLNGKHHREDGPAIEWANGDKEWWLNGQRHRKNEPAVEWVNGGKEWWLNGQRHREDGPAVEGVNGSKEWWLNGKFIRSWWGQNED